MTLMKLRKDFFFTDLSQHFGTLTECSYHVMYPFQSESTLYSYLNVKELLAGSTRLIWSLSDYNGTRTHNHLVHKRKLNHLAKLPKWMSCVVSTYLYGVFDCMFLLCHVRISEWIHNAIVAWMSRKSFVEAGAKSEV